MVFIISNFKDFEEFKCVLKKLNIEENWLNLLDGEGFPSEREQFSKPDKFLFSIFNNEGYSLATNYTNKVGGLYFTGGFGNFSYLPDCEYKEISAIEYLNDKYSKYY